MGRSNRWAAVEAAAAAAAAAAVAVAVEVAVAVAVAADVVEFRADDLDKRCFLATLPFDAPPIPEVHAKSLYTKWLPQAGAREGEGDADVTNCQEEK